VLVTLVGWGKEGKEKMFLPIISSFSQSEEARDDEQFMEIRVVNVKKTIAC
jgi:hypothetical protein